MEYNWAGHLCLSLNGVAVARQIDHGVFAVCVQNGLGTARGTLTGIAAAELACGQSSGSHCILRRRRGLRSCRHRPLSVIGANALLRWREYQAAE